MKKDFQEPMERELQKAFEYIWTMAVKWERLEVDGKEKPKIYEIAKRDVLKELSHQKALSRAEGFDEGFVEGTKSGGGVAPMGVSQWKKYGEQYGYWEYFKKQEGLEKEIKKVEGELLDELRELPEDGYWETGSQTVAEQHREKINQIIGFAKSHYSKVLSDTLAVVDELEGKK